MKKSFSNIVEAAYNLPLKERVKLFYLLGNNITLEKRNKIHSNSQQSMQEEKKKKLVFSSYLDQLKDSL
jgi:hypothetical protein